MFNAEVRLQVGRHPVDYDARVVSDVAGVPRFVLTRIEEADSSSDAVAWYGTFADLAAELARLTEALDAAWNAYNAGPSLPEPVGNAA